jgi:hypothetical protein
MEQASRLSRYGGGTDGNPVYEFRRNMKKIYWIFFFAIIINAGVFGQDRERKFTFQTSPLLYLYDYVSLSVGNGLQTAFIDLESQYKINDIFNISFTFSSSLSFLTGRTSFYTTDYDIYEKNKFQVILKPMFIYRPFRTGLKGFYIGLYSNIGWQSIYQDIDGINGISTGIGIGTNIGYKWISTKGFTLQLGSGIGKTWFIPKNLDYYVINSDARIAFDGFDMLILDFKVGYSF